MLQHPPHDAVMRCCQERLSEWALKDGLQRTTCRVLAGHEVVDTWGLNESVLPAVNSANQVVTCDAAKSALDAVAL